MRTKIIVLLLCSLTLTTASARAATFYVSKLGDNSDGTSWAQAFHTVQAALSAVPDANGGHRIVIRPDRYMEANLFPAHKGAPGAYNLLEVDYDGALGSGATGWAIVDSSDPEKGFKSVDWYSAFRADPEFSGIGWDRWNVRRLYITGGDAGLFWDLTTEKGAEFTVVVEDSVGIGRAFGGGVGAFVGRRDEPVVFRRCQLWCLDWWGDAAGAYVRAERPTMPDFPDIVFEDCTLVGPDNALQAGNPGFDGYSRVKVKNSNLVVFNFSQPRGTPSSGVIYSTIKGEYLHVDLEDSLLMGFKVFGAGKGPEAGAIGYSTAGKVRAYVQYEQDVPEGFERVTQWPAEVFETFLAPPRPDRPALTKLPETVSRDSMESTPVLYAGRPLLMLSRRVGGSNPPVEEMYIHLRDIRSGEEVARLAQGHSFGSAFVEGDQLNVFASEYSPTDWTQSIYRFSSTDLKDWKREPAIEREGDEHLFNSSVCRDDHGYVMAYESNQPVQFCFKFARSTDLARWEKLPNLAFTGEHDEYSACPVLRWFAPWYYVIYLHAAPEGAKGWVSYMARSKDLETWELSPLNPILVASEGEGINNSDVDLFELDGVTQLYYATGDQQDWMELKRAVYPGTMQAFFESHFPTNRPGKPITARRASSK